MKAAILVSALTGIAGAMPSAFQSNIFRRNGSQSASIAITLFHSSINYPGARPTTITVTIGEMYIPNEEVSITGAQIDGTALFAGVNADLVTCQVYPHSMVLSP